MTAAMKEVKFNTLDETYTQISQGGATLSKYANLLFELYNNEQREEQKRLAKKEEDLINESPKGIRDENKPHNSPGILVEGKSNSRLMVRTARCCNPVPGDEIVGYITKGRGISVHRKDCSNMISLPEHEKARFIDVEWEDLKDGKSYAADICIVCADRRGIFSDISRACEDHDVRIEGVNAKSNKNETLNITLTLMLVSTQQLQKIKRTLRNVSGVMSVYRAKS